MRDGESPIWPLWQLVGRAVRNSNAMATQLRKTWILRTSHPAGGIQMQGVPGRPAVAWLQGGQSIDSLVSLGSWKPRCKIQPSWEEAGKDKTGNAGCRRQSAEHCNKRKLRWGMKARISRQILQVPTARQPTETPRSYLSCAPGPRSKAEGQIQPSSLDGE